MAAGLSMRRTPRGFVVVDAGGEEELATITVGTVCEIEAKLPVNAKFRRKWFALLRVAYPHQENWPTFDLFRRAVQRALGFAEIVNGQVFDVSLAWTSMDDGDFRELFERTIALMETRIIPGIDRADVEAEYRKILAGYNDENPPQGPYRHEYRNPACKNCPRSRKGACPFCWTAPERHHFYHHPESDSVFADTAPPAEVNGDGLVNELTFAEYMRLKHGEDPTPGRGQADPEGPAAQARADG